MQARIIKRLMSTEGYVYVYQNRVVWVPGRRVFTFIPTRFSVGRSLSITSLQLSDRACGAGPGDIYSPMIIQLVLHCCTFTMWVGWGVGLTLSCTFLCRIREILKVYEGV